jgi:CheY-like chemotaxis protein
MRTQKKRAKYSSTMLIDDSEIDNFINQKMMEGYAFADHIYVHTSGKSALEFISNIQALGPEGKKLIPEVIFLDINMPILDGFQFVNEFEKLSAAAGSKSKIYILTSSINPADIEKSKRLSAVTGYFSKPLTKEILESV